MVETTDFYREMARQFLMSDGPEPEGTIEVLARLFAVAHERGRLEERARTQKPD